MPNQNWHIKKASLNFLRFWNEEYYYLQCMSTGINYVQDIIDRNCNPVILEVKPFDDTEEAREYQKEVEEEYKLIEAD